MNFRLRQERNAFVFLVVVATPLLLLTAPLPYLTSLGKQKVAQQKAGPKATKVQTVPKAPAQTRS